MNRLGFWIAKARGDEGRLLTLGTPLAAALAELRGMRVALVGNARSLAGGRHGSAIDAADVVIRLNAAPIPAAQSHGTRTDWLAMSIPVDAATIAARAPRRLLWVTPKRKRLPWWLACDPRLTLVPAAHQAALQARLGARPTTGAMMIALLAESEAAAIDIWGFDFFASLSLSGSRDAAKVPHDFAAEAAWVAALIAADPRIRRPGAP